jgi:hypothetical protein
MAASLGHPWTTRAGASPRFLLQTCSNTPERKNHLYKRPRNLSDEQSALSCLGIRVRAHLHANMFHLASVYLMWRDPSGQLQPCLIGVSVALEMCLTVTEQSAEVPGPREAGMVRTKGSFSGCLPHTFSHILPQALSISFTHSFLDRNPSAAAGTTPNSSARVRHGGLADTITREPDQWCYSWARLLLQSTIMCRYVVM